MKEKFLASMNSTLSNHRESEVTTISSLLSQLQSLSGPKGLSDDAAGQFIANFSRFVRTSDITRLLAAHALYERVREVQGSIVEIGVLNGANLFNFGHFIEIFEHRNYAREVFGFDTFNGYPERTAPQDRLMFSDSVIQHVVTSCYEELQASVRIFNASVVMNQFERIHLVQGDVAETVPQFFAERPEFVAALLLCQTDLYEPTKVALDYFLPNMPSGGVVAFGSGNWHQLPGEAIALKESLELNRVRLERLPFTTKLSFFQIQ